MLRCLCKVMRDTKGGLSATVAEASYAIGLVVPKKDLPICLYLSRVLRDGVALLLIGILAPGEGWGCGGLFNVVC